MHNTKKTSRNINVFVGKYLLDSISLGMYDDPLMIVREYIQNSADSLDKQYTKPNRYRGQIDIQINGRDRSIQIKDNGTGIPAWNCRRILSDLGTSQKNHSKERGFRGIGRLGALGYCDELRFITKTSNEDVVSRTIWNCIKLRQLINDKSQTLDLASLVDAVVTYELEKYKGRQNDHFFTVEMTNVGSSRDILLNVPAIKSYLTQVAPVPFNCNCFKFGKELHRKLLENVPMYQTYNIFVNGQKVYKAYSDKVPLHQGYFEDILKIDYFNLSDEPLAFGWLARMSLKGGINPGSLVDGIRVRCGNMQIGGKNFFSQYFREDRFSSYMLGEIHIVDAKIIPNSRRDNFEDVSAVDRLISCFIRDIGLPFSREIRQRSLERSRLKQVQNFGMLESQAKQVITQGYYSESQKDRILNELIEFSKRNELASLGTGSDLMEGLNSSVHVLKTRRYSLPSDIREILINVFDTIYEGTENKIAAEKILENILDKLPSFQLKS